MRAAMTTARAPWVLFVSLVLLAACGEPTMLDRSSSVVKEGKSGTYELSADVRIIDIAGKQVLCGGPVAVRTDKEIEGSPTDLSVQENLAQNYRAARSALETKLVGGDIPKTP
jgi:hypothetical protein